MFRRKPGTASLKDFCKSNDNYPIVGVSVIPRNVKINFTSGTNTDGSGGFTFSRIPAGGPYSFTFSNVGFESQTLSGYNIKEDTTLSLLVKMKVTAASLDQVLVVGYVTQKRKDLTGWVSSV